MDKVAKSLASISLITTLAASGLPVFAQSNPVDPVSNPQLLEYADVAVLPKEMDPPFVRQGQILDPSALHVIDVGTTQDVVRSVLGEPDRVDALEAWEYNLQFVMPKSENYLICQYKVVFDTDRLVRETVWRRRQCSQIAAMGKRVDD